MKPVVRKISALLMVSVLFAVTTGFNLFSHICFMGEGEKQVSTSEIISCCSSTPVPTNYKISATCCDDDVSFIKLDITTVVAKQQFQQELLPVDIFTTNEIFDSEISFSQDLIFDQLPPPKSGRDILTTKRVFRI